MTSELAILQVVRLKGRPAPADVAGAVGASEAEVEDALAAAVASGACEEANGRLRLTPAGRDRLAELAGAERADVDHPRLTSLYEQFTTLNAELKVVVTDWQLRDGQPNDHSDAAYDEGIVDRLAALHIGFSPLLERIVAVAPRLAPYPERFDSALERVQAGQHSWIARPIADSYHTVWFELHEDLIGLLGLSRQEEAASGRAE